MGIYAPMVTYTLNILKGAEAQQQLRYFAEVDPTSPVDIKRGMVVRVTSAGKFLPGVGTTGAMPLYTLGNATDFDVSPGGPNLATDPDAWSAINPSGKLAALACGDYEISTTAFVAGSYTINQKLTSPITGVNAGKLTAGTLNTDTICAVVSRPVATNGHGYQALCVWTRYFPNV